MTPETLLARLRSEAAAIGISLADQHLVCLSRYLELIARWRRRAGLTAVSDPFEAARVHVADSLLLLQAGIPEGSALLDVGSGAGFPGIPLAVVRPDLAVTLLEAARRKAAFLEITVRELAISATVVARRAESFARDSAAREHYDVVAARAVAPLPALLEVTLPFARIGAKIALLKGPGVLREIHASKWANEVLGGGEVSQISARLAGGEERRVIIIQKVRATPAEYPRRAGVPIRSPILPSG